MPDLIPLAALNELRFKTRPLPMTTLRYRARNKQLPGAIFMGTWMVDLDAFDAAVREQTDPASPTPRSSDTELDQQANDIFNQLQKAS